MTHFDGTTAELKAENARRAQRDRIRDLISDVKFQTLDAGKLQTILDALEGTKDGVAPVQYNAALAPGSVHTGLYSHDGYVEHSHEFRPDHLGVERA